MFGCLEMDRLEAVKVVKLREEEAVVRLGMKWAG